MMMLWLQDWLLLTTVQAALALLHCDGVLMRAEQLSPHCVSITRVSSSLLHNGQTLAMFATAIPARRPR